MKCVLSLCSTVAYVFLVLVNCQHIALFPSIRHPWFWFQVCYSYTIVYQFHQLCSQFHQLCSQFLQICHLGRILFCFSFLWLQLPRKWVQELNIKTINNIGKIFMFIKITCFIKLTLISNPNKTLTMWTVNPPSVSQYSVIIYQSEYDMFGELREVHYCCGGDRDDTEPKAAWHRHPRCDTPATA